MTALFVPANRPDRIDKALASAADTVIVDLEDAIAPADKDTARRTLAAWLRSHPDHRIVVRINAGSTAHHAADLALCRDHDSVAVIMLPKAEDVVEIARVCSANRAIWPLIETPAGVLAAPDLARASGVERLAFGALDFAATTGCDAAHAGGRMLLDHARAQIVLASAAAGLSPPIDSPVPEIRDTAPVTAAAEHAVAMGFGGLLAIHPDQLAPIRAAFRPSAAQRDWAQRVIEADHQSPGAAQLDGQMIDAPVIARARRLVAHAEQLGDGD